MIDDLTTNGQYDHSARRRLARNRTLPIATHR